MLSLGDVLRTQYAKKEEILVIVFIREEKYIYTFLSGVVHLQNSLNEDIGLASRGNARKTIKTQISNC